MAATFLLQDWIRVNGAASQTITQAAARWADVSDARDLVVYLSTAALTSSTVISLDTSPSEDADLFRNAATIITGPNTNSITISRYASSSAPLARYLRWKVTNTLAFSATFRIYIGLSPQYGAGPGAPTIPRNVLSLPWTTVAGAAGASVTMAEAEWLDLQDYQDLDMRVNIKQSVGSPVLHLETAPVPDERLFAPMVSRPFDAPNNTYENTIRYQTASVPLARFVRWRLTSASNFNATFQLELTGATRGVVLPLWPTP